MMLTRQSREALGRIGRLAVSQLQLDRAASSKSKTVEVILQEDIPNLGSKGNVASVTRGYLRNYLYPKKMAVYASRDKLASLEKSELDAARARDEQRKAEILRQRQMVTIMTRLTSRPIEVEERTVEGTTSLYGSVTPRMICEAVAKQLNINLPESRVLLLEPIRSTGLHRVPLLLSSGPDGEDDASAPSYMSIVVKDAAKAKKATAATGDSSEAEGGDSHEGTEAPPQAVPGSAANTAKAKPSRADPKITSDDWAV